METCSMCRKKVEKINDQLSNGKHICAECAQKVDELLESNDIEVVHNAIDYIYACAKDNPDGELSDYLMEMLDNNSSAIEELEESKKDTEKKKKQNAPVDSNNHENDFADRQIIINTESGMFGNIGGKIKIVAKVFCWIGIVAFLIVGLFFVIESQQDWFNKWMLGYGIAFIIAGPLISWLGSILMYGFGELIEKNVVQVQLLERLLSDKTQKTKKK